MATSKLNNLMSKLCLDSEKEDELSFYLASLRRKRKSSYLWSKTALFISNIDGTSWIYLEMRKIEEKFAWGCSSCNNLETFRNITEVNDVIENYCVHAQVAFMLIDEDDMESKYNEPKEVIEVLSEKPYYAVAHAGKHPAVIHFPRQTKAPNCSEHPGSHKAKKSKCEHLSVHYKQFREEDSNAVIATGTRDTRAKARANEELETIAMKTKIRPDKNVERIEGEKRKVNPYGIKIPLIPDKYEQDKYKDTKFSFSENLIPEPENKLCKLHGNKYCSQKSALERYLIMSDKVHIHDILPVDDSRNSICRVFYLDTLKPGEENPPCDCHLPYTGEDDHLLPISTMGKDHAWTGRKTMLYRTGLCLTSSYEGIVRVESTAATGTSTSAPQMSPDRVSGGSVETSGSSVPAAT